MRDFTVYYLDNEKHERNLKLSQKTFKYNDAYVFNGLHFSSDQRKHASIIRVLHIAKLNKKLQ